MKNIYDIFIGRCDGWHTFRAASSANQSVLQSFLDRGYRIETEHQIGWFLREIYLVKA